MDFLLKSSAVIVIFYTCYRVFMQRETFFKYNRWFLLSGFLVAILVPFIVVPIYIDYTPIPIVKYAFTYTNENVSVEESFDWLGLLSWVYLGGLVFFSGKLTIEFLSLIRILHKHPSIKSDAYCFIETDENVSPFSFFNWIVYNPDQFETDELKLIIQHEKVHAQQLHSVDLLLTNLACAILWFNPFIWRYKNALQQNLEFLADAETQQLSDCEKTYQTLLLKTSIPSPQMGLTNNFYNSLIKKRIVMLHKSKSNKTSVWKYSLVLPLLTLFIFNFNTKIIAQVKETTIEKMPRATQNILKFVVTKDTKDKQLDFIKDKLTDKGATITFTNLNRNVKDELTSIKIIFDYKETSANHFINSSEPIPPIEIYMNPSDGTINVGQQSSALSQTFDVETKDDGQIKVNKKTTSKSSVFITNDNEAEVIYEEKNNQRTSDLITDDNDDEIEIIYEQPKNLLSNFKNPPLIIIDGEEITTEQMEVIDPKNIGFVSILKDKTATNKYGKKGENGVILITTKKEKMFSNGTNEPLYIVDGKEITNDKLNDIDPSDITHTNILKDEAAIKKYGERGKYGVIIITTKKEKMPSNNANAPLYILDGKEITNKQMEAIDPNTIDSVTVLKDAKATKKYGEKGKNGVIIITLKNNN